MKYQNTKQVRKTNFYKLNSIEIGQDIKRSYTKLKYKFFFVNFWFLIQSLMVRSLTLKSIRTLLLWYGNLWYNITSTQATAWKQI